MIGQTIGHYSVTAKLGAGGMGEVYRARDTKLGREVALKVLPEAFAADAQRMARFQREAQVLAALNHPHIAAIYGLEEGVGARLAAPAESASGAAPSGAPTGAIRALVMELVEGPTLANRVSGGAIPIEEALPIARQIAEALEYAHERGIIHRDLKPANIKFTPDGAVKILDFGLAKALAEDVAHTDASTSPTLSIAATKAGIILGTAAYMSPEQARGKPADRRADIWSFGVVLYEMLSGKQLYGGETVSDSMAAVITREPEWAALPQTTPPRVRELLRRCLVKDPRQRLRDIGDARIALEEALAQPEGKIQEERAGKMPALQKKSVLPWAATAMLGVAAIALGGLYARVALREPPLVRTEIAPPKDGAFFLFTTNPGPVAISPDGSTLAFVAVEKDNVPRMYVRRLNSAETQVIAGTENAAYPFWSPDSKWVAFFGGGKLRKTDLSGAPPVVLCDAGVGKGGTWNGDGVLLYAPSFDSQIHRTTAAGGDCKPITKLNAERGDNSHRHPRFLPDGKRFLYFARSSSAVQGAHALIAAMLDSKEEKVLMQSSTMAEYVSGYLLYLRDVTLVARPFDAGKLQFTGEATTLVDDVMNLGGGAGAGVFSVSATGTLVYLPGGVRANDHLIWQDRDGKQAQKLSQEAIYAHVTLSPDARSAIVYVSDQISGNNNLWLYDLKRDLITRFTFGAGAVNSPIWSPDGSTAYYAAGRNGKNFDLYRKPVSGAGEEEQVFGSGENKYPTSFTQDGKLLLFSVKHAPPKGGESIWVLPVTGERKPWPLLEGKFNYWGGVVSFDGKWVAYVSNESGRTEVFVTSFPKPGRKWQVSKNGGYIAFWRRDGKEILYQSPDGRMIAVDVTTRGEVLELGAEHPLLQLPTFQEPFCLYSPTTDHQRFLSVSGISAQPRDPLRLIFNWPALLKK
jgi:Tol biopolymer transport system component